MSCNKDYACKCFLRLINWTCQAENSVHQTEYCTRPARTLTSKSVSMQNCCTILWVEEGKRVSTSILWFFYGSKFSYSKTPFPCWMVVILCGLGGYGMLHWGCSRFAVLEHKKNCWWKGFPSLNGNCTVGGDPWLSALYTDPRSYLHI